MGFEHRHCLDYLYGCDKELCTLRTKTWRQILDRLINLSLLPLCPLVLKRTVLAPEPRAPHQAGPGVPQQRCNCPAPGMTRVL